MTGTNILGQNRFNGILTFAVYRENATGFLDFLYQYHANLSQDGVQRLSTVDFPNFMIDVTHLTGTAPPGFVLGSSIPSDATRSDTPGSIVGFDFRIPNDITTGMTSQVLVLHTDATTTVPGATSAINGAVATVVTRGPATTPEPATLTLFAGGLLGLGGAFWRKRKALIA
jgi:hypothetical protein